MCFIWDAMIIWNLSFASIWVGPKDGPIDIEIWLVVQVVYKLNYFEWLVKPYRDFFLSRGHSVTFVVLVYMLTGSEKIILKQQFLLFPMSSNIWPISHPYCQQSQADVCEFPLCCLVFEVHTAYCLKMLYCCFHCERALSSQGMILSL